MTRLFYDIESWMDANPHGWSTKAKVTALVGAILAFRAATIVEIGIWSGKSFIPMAMALKYLKSKGAIIGLDPWSVAASVEGQEGEHKDWWAKVDHEQIYQTFTAELVKTGVAPWTKVFRCRSDEWKLPNDLLIDLLHIDGNHGEFASTYDVTHFAPRVRVGGLLFFDDLAWAAKASAMLPILGFKPLFDEDGGSMYQRICMSDEPTPTKRESTSHD